MFLNLIIHQQTLKLCPYLGYCCHQLTAPSNSKAISKALNCFFFVVLVRKISRDLASVANLPLYGEEDWPRANICAHLPPFDMWDACHGMT